MMRNPSPSTERCRNVNPFDRPRRADPRPNAGRRGRWKVGRRAWAVGGNVVPFGAGDFVGYPSGRWGARSASAANDAPARGRSSPPRQGAACSSERLPAADPLPLAARVIHNRVLIADDDGIVRGSLAAVLESEGFVVDEAEDGIKAVARAIDHKPDLVLLDLNMPHWDGWTAFSQLDRVTPLLPVIVITARPNQYQKAVQLGVDAFMEKPLDIGVLVRAIKRLTSEDENRHVRRITNRAFVTQLLDSTGS